MSTSAAVEIRGVAWDDGAGEALRVAQQAEISTRYGVPDSEPGPKPTAADITLFLIAYDDGAPVGCGGLRTLDAEHGEIKRMYVIPERRGTGVSVRILSALEDEARELGWSRVVLETGDLQPDAMRFYEREGYHRIPNFGYYADSELSVCYEKALIASPKGRPTVRRVAQNPAERPLGALAFGMDEL